MKIYTKVLLAVFLGILSINSFAQAPKLIGVTRLGGAYANGTIFKTDITGENHEIIYNFAAGGGPMGSLMQASNGKLYGMTANGGSDGKGTLFEYDLASSTFTKKLDFDGTDKGAYPNGSLIQASNGKLYGMAQAGGTNAKGVLFEYDPTSDTYTKKLDFDGTNGSYPLGDLVQATNGKLYGMTANGGDNDLGVLFEYDPASGTFTKKLNFDGANMGSYPKGSLMLATNGKLYGMTQYGGSNDLGVLFEYDPTSATYAKKINFDGVNMGSYPKGSLMQATNGKLYGMTSYGGTSITGGTLFEYDPTSATYTKKVDLGSNTGGKPYGSLMQASNGKLYGMSTYGGASNYGTFFEYDPASETFTKKLDFNGINGGRPYYSALIETDGNVGINTTGDKSNIYVYPNPSNGILSIEGQNIKSVSIMDLSGKIVFKRTITGGKTTLDLNNLPKSLYFIRIESEKEVRVKKLILM